MTNGQLTAYFERIERLNEEKAGIADDIKEVFAEAKANGFDTKIMREVLKLRKMEASDRAEYEALVDSYKAAVGMLADTPLGRAAMPGGEA